HFAEKLQAFGGEIGRNEGDPGDVAARTSEARYKTRLNRIHAYHHDDGYCARCRSYERRHVAAERKYHIRSERNELLRERAQPFRVTFCIPVLDDNVLGFNVSEFSQTSAKCAK